VLARIGALGDIHAEDAALFAALTFLRSQRLDAILAAGDIMDGVGDADRCCALLRDCGVLTVRGNHDRWFLEGSMRGLDIITKDVAEPHRRWLESLPATRRFETPLGPLLLCHGIGEDDMSVLKSHTDAYTLRWLTALTELQRDPDVELMLAGHTHERMVRKLEGLTAINAGTLHRDCDPGFLVVDFEARAVLAYDIRDGAVRPAERYPL
jgi:putative phosphoesterase